MSCRLCNFMDGLRIGIGKDFHVLQRGRKFTLGGVIIDVSYGPVAHSDGDCLIHAMADSLLGALALPNIGVLFPDTEVANRGRSSLQMLGEVMKKVLASGYCIQNMDAVIQLERPQISSYFPQMRQKLAPVLHLREDCIGLKATTREGVGAIGRGEAIETICVCLLRRLP